MPNQTQIHKRLHKDFQFTKEKQHILKTERMERVNVWHFGLKNYSNDESIIEKVGNEFSVNRLVG